jgi:hypothetical protein
MQASAVPVTQAVGNLLTTFTQHVEDHRRHVRMSQMCGLILDSSSWCGSPDIEAEATIVSSPVEELTQQAQLNVVAKRFVPRSDKLVTVDWGDGTQTLVSGAKNNFNAIPHTYDLMQATYPTSYTIYVTVEDQDLDFSRFANTSIVLSPKVNPAGEPTKTSFRAGAKLLVQPSGITTAGAKIKNQVSSTTTAGAKIAS